MPWFKFGGWVARAVATRREAAAWIFLKLAGRDGKFGWPATFLGFGILIAL